MLGLYVHIPFCSAICNYCNFNRGLFEAGLKERYVAALLTEIGRAGDGSPADTIFFGGGTPSFLSIRQLDGLAKRLAAVSEWRDAEEVAFECEPGTLTEGKLAAIRRMGVTRLSLGIENFSDRILELNGRAHRSPEVFRAYEQARTLEFPQINVDLIAGMLGETEENWQACVQKTVELAPDSVTIYQMELPFNTAISGDLLKGTGRFQEPVADWSTKRRWVREAFEALEAAGYHVRSAYTAVRNPSRTRFVYTDRLWQGADMVGLGVASFGHVNGVHVQNLDTWEAYSTAIRNGDIALSRAYKPTGEERMIRELVLQLKFGSIKPAYFRARYDVNVLERFRVQLDTLAAGGYLKVATQDVVALTREGLLRVDALLAQFFLPEHAGIRYS